MSKSETTPRPCPHCGDASPYVERESICVFYVRCDCSAQGPKVERMSYEWNQPAAHRAAIKAWNRRKMAHAI